ncbi:Ferredoxin-dependent glutamate synthase 2 [Anaerolineae bacterium]|nr:Ferredoxin-dependent glutamate synthase 2 [Anaerolineae bacterium]
MMEVEYYESQIDLAGLLSDPDPSGTRPRANLHPRNDPHPIETLDDWLFDATVNAVARGAPISVTRAIKNTDRTVGARIAGEIARLYGDAGLPAGTIRATLRGSAGQSFGAFCVNGLALVLIGEANDYVGKGMAGGEIVIRLPERARWKSNENFILGNTVLYGATGGALFAAGCAGERFAVRNSGAVAVVEGVGDHGCEYMTGGTVVVLGATGRNFGAGMTGGIAFVYDRANTLATRLNAQLVRMERLANDADESRLRDLVSQHANATGSAWSRELLERWSETRGEFWGVIPK